MVILRRIGAFYASQLFDVKMCVWYRLNRICRKVELHTIKIDDRS